MALEIFLNPAHASVTVQLVGSLDTATAPQLQRTIDPIIDSQYADLIFDLARLDFISSAGLRVFFVARKRLAESNHEASFINLQPQIRDVFDIVKALPGVNIFSNEAEMDQYLAARQNQRKGDGGESSPPLYNIDL